ncbi:M12 family metallopeptidase [uncultured Paludibaculum sp.]|uniref:M12 family metallopeptidase n=1 Tax=uncultured Paludibaculum sp. TaxID=1765020 RepID=UPI002AABD598|nr:M12 family metallopeptidase [uncultured Paludibaculum sp.]
MKNVIVCSPKSLPREQLFAAAKTAVAINPLNHAPLARLASLMPSFRPTREHLAVVTTKYWGLKGVKLTVGFMDHPPADLRKRILLHMNAWASSANVKFAETKTDPQVRIAREGGNDGGYWSYVGTDITHIPKSQQTMNLEAFTMNTPESEFHRVVRHETGHTLGFPHEHMRAALVAKIDPEKAIEYFMRTQGWSEDEVRAQVLTPIEEGTLMGTVADPQSIMCYQIPGEITKDGKPIVGGRDIDRLDFSFAASIYPKKTAKPAPKSAPMAKKAKAGKR